MIRTQMMALHMHLNASFKQPTVARQIYSKADLITSAKTRKQIEESPMNPHGLTADGTVVFFPIYPRQIVTPGNDKRIYHMNDKKEYVIDILYVYKEVEWKEITKRHPMNVLHNNSLPVGGCLFRVIRLAP